MPDRTEGLDLPTSSRLADRQARLPEAVFWGVALVTTGLAFASLYWPFISGEAYHYHDSSVPATEIGLFYDRLFGSDSWLWSDALNGGQPLWLSLETMPFFDPIAFVVYAVATMLKSEWWAPYHVTVFAWMFALALGGALCTRQLTRNRWAALLTFLLLFAGPLAFAIPSQSNGFLCAFRYFPLAVYFYLRLRQSVRPATLLYFTTTIAFGLAGYQSVYVVVLFIGLGLSELLIDRAGYLAWLRQLLRPRLAALFLIPLAGLAPLVAWLAYLQDVVAISRSYRFGHVYFIELSRFAADLLTTYPDILRFQESLSIHHGSTFLGFFVLPFLLLGFRRSALAAFAALGRGGEQATQANPIAVLWLWLLITAALTNGLFGLGAFVKTHGALLGIRNYGFLLTGCLFLLALLAGYGLSEVAAGRYGPRDVLIDTLVFAVLAGGVLWGLEGHRGGALALALSVAVFALVAAMWHRLAQRLGIAWGALPGVVVVFLELTVSTQGHLQTLNAAAAQIEGLDAAALARSRAPRLGQPAERLPAYRKFAYSGYQHWPYNFEGPAVFKEAFAYSEPYQMTPLSSLGFHGITHFFRMAAYDALLQGGIEPDTLRAVLGVTRPILELVPPEAVESRPEGLSFVLGERPAGAPQPPAAAGEIAVSDYEGDRLRVAVETPEAALLVYRDNMAPGWTVCVDGATGELLVVDRVNKAVTLAPGRHEVEFLYRPWPYIAAFSLRAVVLLGGGLACIALALRRRRQDHARAPGAGDLGGAGPSRAVRRRESRRRRC